MAAQEALVAAAEQGEVKDEDAERLAAVMGGDDGGDDFDKEEGDAHSIVRKEAVLTGSEIPVTREAFLELLDRLRAGGWDKRAFGRSAPMRAKTAAWLLTCICGPTGHVSRASIGLRVRLTMTSPSISAAQGKRRRSAPSRRAGTSGWRSLV